MYKKYSKVHNQGIYIWFIKPSECWMGGEQISLLRLLRLKSALRSTITCPAFLLLHDFKKETSILMNEDVWKNLFTVCHALYAPMRVLCLADQKTPAMDKLHYFVCQTNHMLPKYLAKAEKDNECLLFGNSFLLMTNLVSEKSRNLVMKKMMIQLMITALIKKPQITLMKRTMMMFIHLLKMQLEWAMSKLLFSFFSFTSNLFLYSQFMQLYRSISRTATVMHFWLLRRKKN